MSTASENSDQEINEVPTEHGDIVAWEALLAYIPLFCLYPWSLRKSRPELAEHAQQGMILFIAELVLFLVSIPFLVRLIWLGVIVLAIIGLVSVLSGRPYRLPVLADLVDRIRG